MLSNDTLTIYFDQAPTIADPLEFDLFSNHIAFRSVLAGLVVKSHKSGFRGILSKEWTISSDKKQIQFVIRENVRFENGDLITPDIIKTNFKRMAFLQKKRNSNAGLTEFVQGIESMRSPCDEITGIVTDKSTITFKFTRPMEKLLDLMSFGLYSVAHPSNFSF